MVFTAVDIDIGIGRIPDVEAVDDRPRSRQMHRILGAQFRVENDFLTRICPIGDPLTGLSVEHDAVSDDGTGAEWERVGSSPRINEVPRGTL